MTGLKLTNTRTYLYGILVYMTRNVYHLRTSRTHAYFSTRSLTQVFSQKDVSVKKVVKDKELSVKSFKGVSCLVFVRAAVKDESVLIYLRRCGERSGAKMI